jgi:hypothetical protein
VKESSTSHRRSPVLSTTHPARNTPVLWTTHPAHTTTRLASRGGSGGEQHQPPALTRPVDNAPRPQHASSVDNSSCPHNTPRVARRKRRRAAPATGAHPFCGQLILPTQHASLREAEVEESSTSHRRSPVLWTAHPAHTTTRLASLGGSGGEQHQPPALSRTVDNAPRPQQHASLREAGLELAALRPFASMRAAPGSSAQPSCRQRTPPATARLASRGGIRTGQRSGRSRRGGQHPEAALTRPVDNAPRSQQHASLREAGLGLGGAQAVGVEGSSSRKRRTRGPWTAQPG